jgi:outer membrane protein TolC
MVLVGCSANAYRQRADAETMALLFGKTDQVENVENDSLKLPSPIKFDNTKLKPRAADSLEFLGANARLEKNAKLMTLDQALETGIAMNRPYLARKESVFLTALDLTLVQYRLSPIFGAGTDGTYKSDSRNAIAQAGLTDLVATNTFSRNQFASFSRLYKTGARLTADFSQDFLKFLTGNNDVNDSALAVTLIQPLLKGGGTKATLEALTQADRDVLYALRDFANFRREFIVDLVASYYAVLLARENAINAHLAYQGFYKNVERDKAMAEENRRTQAQLGRLQQALLIAESRWLSSVRIYENRLDQFKLTLGIPVSEIITLDSKELDKLKIEDPDITREQAFEIALVSRPDLATNRDRVADAERKILVAENGLKPGLDIRVDYDVISDRGDVTPDLNFDRRNIETNLDLDLPLDRKAERNIYRESLITRNFRQRQYEESIDRVHLQINDDWRALELAKRSYDIAQRGVALAQRRLDEQNLLSEIGQGQALDLVDAQEDLLSAENQLSSALIDHTVARLRLWRDLGILYINEDGSWIEKLEQESKAHNNL